MSDIAKLGFSVDTSGLKKGEKSLNDFAKTGESTEKSIDSSSKKIQDDFKGIEASVNNSAAAQKKAEKQMAQFSRRSGQAGIQFQQFIGQVQGGQGVMLALSQQSADLGFVLGAPLLGAIAGISASLVGLLIPNLIDTTSAMEDLDKAMAEINKTATDSDGIKAFTKEIATLAEESEAAARLMILAAEQSARDAGKAAAEGIGEEFNDAFDVTIFQKSFDALKSIAGTAGGTGFSISQEYKELGEQFGLTGKEAREAGVSVLVSLREMENAVSGGLPDAGQKIISFQEKLSELAETASGEKKTKLLSFVNSISEYVSKAKLAAEMSELFNETLNESDLDIPTEETNKLADSVKNVSESLQAQIVALRDGEEAAINYSIAQRLGLEDAELIPESIRLQIEQIKALKLARDEDFELMRQINEETKLFDAQQKKAKADAEKLRKKEAQDFKKLTKDIENFGGAWTKTGSVIVDAFGDISDAMNDYMDQLSEIEKNEKSLAVFRKEKGEDNIEVIALQNKLESDRINAELSGIKSLSKAGESLFSEKTAAAKAFAALNKVITVAEIALSFQKMAASTAETTTHVANETTKQGSNALTAITSAFAAPFPVNFVAGAAMIGIMASLLGGFASSGGSVDMTEQRQETQGTGTVLGSDDKTESIINSFERYEEISIDQLFELRGIKSSLGAISDGISLVTRDLVASGNIGEFQGDLSKKQSGTGIINLADKLGLSSVLGIFGDNFVADVLGGLFGSTKKKVTDSGIQFISQSLGDILDSGIVEAQAFFDIEKTKKKLFGLSKKVTTSTEFQDIDGDFGAQIGAIFSNIGDVVSQSADLLGFDVDEALQNFQIDLGMVSLEGLSGEEIEKELQAVFGQQADLIAGAAIPSLKEFQKVGEGLFDTLTRVTQEQAVFNDSIERIGFDLSELSSIMKIEVAQSIISLTGGFEEFSDLTNSFFDNFFSDAEQFAVLEQSLTDVFDSLGLSVSTSREEFKALVEGVDITTEEGQELLAVLLQINPALSDYIDELERVEEKRVDMTIELLRLQGNAEEALAMQREIELAALDESLRALQLLIFAEEDRIALLEEQEQAARSAFSVLEDSINLEKQRVQAVFDVASAAHEAELERIDLLRTSLNNENELRKANLAEAEGILTKSFNNEISLIQSNANERIQALNSEKTAINSTASAMRSLVSNINKSLGLDGSSDLIGALSSARAGDFSKAKNLNIGSLTSLDSMDFSSATDLRIQEAINQNRLATISGLAGEELTEAESMINAIDSQIALTKENADKEALALKEQLNSLLNIDDGVLSVSEAINNFNEAQSELEKLNFEVESEKLDMLIESSEDVFNLHKNAYEKELNRLDSILSVNLQMLNASLNINNSVLTIPNAIMALQQTVADIPVAPVAPVAGETNEKDVANEIKQLREENAAFQRAIVKNTQTSASAAKDGKLNGVDVRVIS